MSGKNNISAQDMITEGVIEYRDEKKVETPEAHDHFLESEECDETFQEETTYRVSDEEFDNSEFWAYGYDTCDSVM